MFSPMQLDDDTHADLQLSSGQVDPQLPLYNSCTPHKIAFIDKVIFIFVIFVKRFMDV